MGAKVMCMVPVSAATAATALAGGVAAEPIRMSTLSSVTKRRAVFVALVGAGGASRMMTVIFFPPMLGGQGGREFWAGGPSAEAARVGGRLTQLLMWAGGAPAAEPARARTS